jgi:hypothetical protein
MKNNHESGQFMIAGTLDYTFSKGWYVYLSYMYQQKIADSKLTEPKETAIRIRTPKYLMPFEHSMYAGIMKELSPLFSAQMAVIYGDLNHTTLFYPALTWHVSEETDLLLTGTAFMTGKGVRWENTVNSAFLRFKYSF